MRSVAKPVTKQDPGPAINPNTVRVERNPDEYGPTWRVLAGDTDSPILLGYVEAARTVTGKRSTGRWIATTPNHTHLTTTHAGNRTTAVAAVLDFYHHTAGTR